MSQRDVLEVRPTPSLTVVEVGHDRLPHFREMVRQQLLGDVELMRDIRAGREDPETRLQISDRLVFMRELATQFGIPENPDRRRKPRSGTIPPRPSGWRIRLAELVLGT